MRITGNPPTRFLQKAPGARDAVAPRGYRFPVITSSHTSGAATRRRFPLGLLLDLVLVAVAVGLVVWAALAGWALRGAGVDIFLGWPPLLAGWSPHVGPGTVPAILLAALVVVRGPELAARLPWRVLMPLGYVASVCWTLFLALVDGWQTGIAGRLTTIPEYLHDVGKVGGLAQLLSGFSSHILTGNPGSWTIHVGAHPPGAFLIFVVLDKIGLGGGGVAGLLCILLGASACVAVAVAMRALGHETLARRVLPFGVLFPGAVWVGVSADGMFAGILAWGVALLAIGCGRGRWRLAVAFAGGLVLGYVLYLSYGLALAGLLPIAVIAVTRRWAAAGVATIGVAAIVAAFTFSGFWWFTGFDLVKIIYADSIAKTRPYGYFLWADLAALAFVIGPAVLVGARRMLARPRRLPLVATALVAAAVLAVLAADVSGMSKAEVERIWLPFAVWMMLPCALLPPRHVRGWLALQGILALLVNHLLFTIW
jgi:hypothetical protein